jgi:hypothetical protein
VNTMRQLGFAIGIAVLGSLFAARAAASFQAARIPGPDELSHALAGGQAGRILAQADPTHAAAAGQLVHSAAIAGLHGAFWAAGIIGVAAGIAVLALVRKPAPAAQQQRWSPEAKETIPAEA